MPTPLCRPGISEDNAIAETLSGKNNPAGRTHYLYKDVHQLPHFEDYSMNGRTYRYFKGEPLGLSDMASAQAALPSRVALPPAPINANDPADLHRGNRYLEVRAMRLCGLNFPMFPGRRFALFADFSVCTWSRAPARRFDSIWNSRM